jgi:hypothetical protein
MEIWWGRRATKKRDCRKAKSDRNIKKHKRETTGKQGEMEIWWGRRTAKKGYYRQARRDGETKETEKQDCRQAKRDGNIVAEESSQQGRLQASKERWKYKEAE